VLFLIGSFVVRHFVLAVMIALKDVVSSEFVERVHAFFSKSGPLSKARNFEFATPATGNAAAVQRRWKKNAIWSSKQEQA